MSDQTSTEALDESDVGANDAAEVQSPEFQSFNDAGTASTKNEINRFADIKIAVSAELGRTQVTIEKLLSLGKGNVLPLDREINSPVELIAQGIPLACGEVVVVDDHFAIRITEVYPRNRSGEKLIGEE